MDLYVNEICYQSNPCVHDIELGVFKERWNGIKICQYYIDNSWPIPQHFIQWISKCEKKCDSLNKYRKYYPKKEIIEIHTPPGFKNESIDNLKKDPMYEIRLLQ